MLGCACINIAIYNYIIIIIVLHAYGASSCMQSIASCTCPIDPHAHMASHMHVSHTIYNYIYIRGAIEVHIGSNIYVIANCNCNSFKGICIVIHIITLLIHIT